MYTYSSVLRVCDGLLSFRQFYGSLFKYGFEFDVFVRSVLIDVYAKWGDLGNVLVVFNEFVIGDLVVWNLVIGVFVQNSFGDEVLNLFKKMKRVGF